MKKQSESGAKRRDPHKGDTADLRRVGNEIGDVRRKNEKEIIERNLTTR